MSVVLHPSDASRSGRGRKISSCSLTPSSCVSQNRMLKHAEARDSFASISTGLGTTMPIVVFAVTCIPGMTICKHRVRS